MWGNTIRADSAPRGVRGMALGVLAAALGLGQVSPAGAGASYGALGSAPSSTPVTFTGGPGGPASPNITIVFTGAASPGAVGSITAITTPTGGTGYAGLQSAFPTYANFDDFVVTGPGSGTVSVSLNLSISGTISNIPTVSGVQPGTDTSIGTVDPTVVIGGHPSISSGLWSLTGGTAFTGSIVDNVVTCIAPPNGLCTPTHTTLPSGLLAGITVSAGLFTGTVTTPVFTVPLNTPFSVGLQLVTSGVVVPQVGVTIPNQPADTVSNSLGVDFLDPFSFPTSGPVFNLPAGYTVNSTEAMVVNNQFMASAPLVAPSGVTATAGNAQIELQWNAVTGATSYNIYQGTGAGGEGTAPAQTGITATSVTITGLSNGTPYFFTVTAEDSTGEGVHSSEVSATPTAPPGQVDGLTATAGNAQVQLSWSGSSGATSYNIYQGIIPGSEAAMPVQTGIVGTSTTVSALTNGTIYYFTVAATNAGGTGPASSETSATPLAGPVATPTFDPAPGGFSAAQSVTISDTNSGATIFYTTDGTTPTTSSTQYAGTINISATTTLEAVATAKGYANSSVASATYTITAPAKPHSAGGGAMGWPSVTALLIAVAWRLRRHCLSPAACARR